MSDDKMVVGELEQVWIEPPGALVIAKIVYPETEASTTKSGLRLDIERKSVNALDAIAIGAVEAAQMKETTAA